MCSNFRPVPRARSAGRKRDIAGLAVRVKYLLLQGNSLFFLLSHTFDYSRAGQRCIVPTWGESGTVNWRNVPGMSCIATAKFPILQSRRKARSKTSTFIPIQSKLHRIITLYFCAVPNLPIKTMVVILLKQIASE